MGSDEPKYGWLKYRPRFLQSCLTSRCILVACSLLVAAEGVIVNDIVSVTITSLEKRFYLKSFQVGGIITCYEVSAVVLTLMVSYYGHVHKAKWVGSGAIAMGIGWLVFAMPQWLSGKYVPIVAQTSDYVWERPHTTPPYRLTKHVKHLNGITSPFLYSDNY